MKLEEKMAELRSGKKKYSKNYRLYNHTFTYNDQ